MKVKDVMTTDVVTVSPGESLKEVARLLVERHISGVPVVDGERTVLGVVSEADLLVEKSGRPHEGLDLDPRVAGEAMTTPPETIEPQRPVGLAAARLMEKGIHRLPVVADGKLVGIVTRADLVRAFARPDAELAREIREDVIGEIMLLDTNAVEVEVEAGEVLLRGQVGRRSQAELLPVLTARVLGVVGVHSTLTWTSDDTG